MKSLAPRLGLALIAALLAARVASQDRGDAAGDSDPLPGIGGKYGARHHLQAFVGRWPPNPAASLRRGFDRLLECQAPDGRFGSPDDVLTTATACLALLCDERIFQSGRHADAVRRAGAWLVSRQEQNGALSARVGEHAWATNALAELHVHEPTPVLAAVLERAFAFALLVRTPGRGWLVEHPRHGLSATPAMLLAFADNAWADAGMQRALTDAQWAEVAESLDDGVAHGNDRIKDQRRAIGVLVQLLRGRGFAVRPSDAACLDVYQAVQRRAAADDLDPELDLILAVASTQCEGVHQCPEMHALDQGLVPAILATQQPDGGWPETEEHGAVTTTALRLLTLASRGRYTRMAH